jgi:hypothetical protein
VKNIRIKFILLAAVALLAGCESPKEPSNNVVFNKLAYKNLIIIMTI